MCMCWLVGRTLTREEGGQGGCDEMGGAGVDVCVCVGWLGAP